MRKRWMHLIAGSTMLVLCISICITTSNATTIWEDNFENESLPGWTFYGWEGVSSPVKTEGNFSAADGTLKALDDDINVARHDSTVNVGTWKFDMYVPDDADGSVYLEFMSNGADHLELSNSSVMIVGAWLNEGRFMVWSMVGTSVHVSKNIHIPLQGWHHLEVSRTSDGHFYVWFNGTLEADFDSSYVTDSTYLQFWCETAVGAALDNLVVDDIPKEPPTTSTTPTTTTGGDGGIDPTLIIIGVGVAAVVIVVAVVFLRRR